MSRTARPPRNALGSGQVSDALSWSTLISTDELARHLDDPRFVIVDVRHDLAQPERFGDDAYATRLTMEAKAFRRAQSELERAIDTIIHGLPAARRLRSRPG